MYLLVVVVEQTDGCEAYKSNLRALVFANDDFTRIEIVQANETLPPQKSLRVNYACQYRPALLLADVLLLQDYILHGVAGDPLEKDHTHQT